MAIGLLDIYVLSLLDRGLDTPYSLQREGGLSLGATTPSLRRLLKHRFVERQDEKGATNRPRHVYTLTAAGRKVARTDWKEHLHGGRIPGDLDAVLRLAEMATLYGATPREVANLLKQASDYRRSLARKAVVVSDNPRRTLSYQEMRSVCDAARLRAEAEALVKLAAQVGRQTGVRADRRDIPLKRQRKAATVPS